MCVCMRSQREIHEAVPMSDCVCMRVWVRVCECVCECVCACVYVCVYLFQEMEAHTYA